MAKVRSVRGKSIVVVGAGAFGGWTALYLQRRGARVTLIDAWGAGNARASSGGESRVIRSVYGPDRIYLEMVKRAFVLWQENQQRWQAPLYHKTGALWLCSHDDAYVRQSLPIAHDLGIRIDTLELADAAKRYRQVNFEGVQQVYFEPEAGFLLARRACQVVCEQFVREGGTYVESAARPGRFEQARLANVQLAGGDAVAADCFIFACGPWLGSLFPAILGSYLRPTRQEVFYFGTPLGNSDFAAGRLPVWIDLGKRIFYGIPATDGRGFKVADDTRGAAFEPTSGDRTPTAAGCAVARRLLARRFPALRDAPLLEARVCQYENSPDGHLIIDRHPEAGNVWLMGGGSGHGFKLGPALGEWMAGVVSGELPAQPEFSLARLATVQKQATQFESRAS